MSTEEYTSKSEYKIIFKDKNGLPIIMLDNFVYSESVIRVFDYQISISYEFFRAVTKIDCEAGDLGMFSDHLNLFYKGGPNACHFSPDISSHFSIHFYHEESGIITVNAKLGVPSSDSELDIYYQIDQSFIPDLIKQIDNVLTLAPL